jgi:hypothetical protein
MNFSHITPNLIVGGMPGRGDYAQLHEMGVQLVLNMRLWERLPAGEPEPPMPVILLHTVDSPFTPIPLSALEKGVRAALPIIEAGGRVYAHCAYGRHRGVAMGSAILIAQGYTAKDAMRLIKEKRPIADPDAFYIRWRIEAFERKWADSSNQ